MYRIGILGSENSHARVFSQMFNGLDPACAGLYPDLQVAAIGGDDQQASQAIAAECSIPLVANRPEEMLGHVDAVMVTARNGKFHFPFAKPFIEAGLPCFIDKPLANDAGEARAMLNLALEKGVPIVGGSSTKYAEDVLALKAAVASGALGTLRSGAVSAPVNLDNPYGGFYFYSAHLVEILMTIFGYDPVSVYAQRHEGRVTAIFHYPDYDITGHFIEGTGLYSAAAYGTLANRQSAVDITACYALEAANFARMLRTGRADQPMEELLRPVEVLNALEKSYLTGRPAEL
jgi:predicted dehydrogenase